MQFDWASFTTTVKEYAYACGELHQADWHGKHLCKNFIRQHSMRGLNSWAVVKVFPRVKYSITISMAERTMALCEWKQAMTSYIHGFKCFLH